MGPALFFGGTASALCTAPPFISKPKAEPASCLPKLNHESSLELLRAEADLPLPLPSAALRLARKATLRLARPAPLDFFVGLCAKEYRRAEDRVG